MPSFRISGSRCLAIAVVILGALAFPSDPLKAQNQPNPPAAAETQDQSPVKFRVKSNLVVVRVVGGDGKGKPVEGLKKEDFKLFDQGKEQSIVQFDVEKS